jgi:hypothetical protein
MSDFDYRQEEIIKDIIVNQELEHEKKKEGVFVDALEEPALIIEEPCLPDDNEAQSSEIGKLHASLYPLKNVSKNSTHRNSGNSIHSVIGDMLDISPVVDDILIPTNVTINVPEPSGPGFNTEPIPGTPSVYHHFKDNSQSESVTIQIELRHRGSDAGRESPFKAKDPSFQNLKLLDEDMEASEMDDVSDSNMINDVVPPQVWHQRDLSNASDIVDLGTPELDRKKRESLKEITRETKEKVKEAMKESGNRTEAEPIKEKQDLKEELDIKAQPNKKNQNERTKHLSLPIDKKKNATLKVPSPSTNLISPEKSRGPFSGMLGFFTSLFPFGSSDNSVTLKGLPEWVVRHPPHSGYNRKYLTVNNQRKALLNDSKLPIELKTLEFNEDFACLLTGKCLTLF